MSSTLTVFHRGMTNVGNEQVDGFNVPNFPTSAKGLPLSEFKSELRYMPPSLLFPSFLVKQNSALNLDNLQDPFLSTV